MKLLFSLFFLFCLVKPLSSSEEVLVLEELISSTQNKLEEEKKILKLLRLFNETREAFIAEPTSAKLATKLVKISVLLDSEIEKSCLADIFSKEFLEEITFFSQVGIQKR